MSLKVGDLIPIGGGGYSLLSNVEYFDVVEVGNEMVSLTWQDPEDVVVDGITITSWEGTQIRRKQGNYPVNEKDGELVVDSKVRNQHQNTPFVDTGLTNGVEYFYMAFPYTDKNVFTVDSANRISEIPMDYVPDPNSWSGIQEIIRRGLVNDYFNVGDQIASSYDGSEIVWEVIGIDVDTPTDSNFAHSMTIQTKDCLESRVWDAGNDNRYINSDIRTYLNGVFLNKLDTELASVLGAVDKKVAVRDAIGGQDSFSDKVFLLSELEVSGSGQGDTTGEVVYPFYDGVANAARIKNLNGSPSHWWLSSPRVSDSHNVRRVLTDGSISLNLARLTYGVAPACVII